MIKLSTVFILLSLSATSYSKPIPDYFRDVSTEVLELKLENIGLAPLEKKMYFFLILIPILVKALSILN